MNLLFRIRSVNTIALPAILALASSYAILGAFPQEFALRQDPPNQSDTAPLKASSKVQNAIENAIENALENPAETQETGDPVLDGVLDVIRQQGSRVQQAIPEVPSLRGLPIEQTDNWSSNNPPSEQNCRLAEQLLKTARLLSKQPDSLGRRELIESLRLEAARCLD